MKLDKQELKRQLFHLGLGIVIVLLFYFNLLTELELFIILVIGGVLAVLASKWKVPGINWFLKKFEREKVRFPGEGAIFYVLGCFLVLGLFPRDIAFASIMVLAVGDSFATLVGSSLGKRKIKNKTLEGSLSGLITGFFAAMIFVSAAMAFSGTLVAMIFEAVELKLFGKTVDDNLFIPIIAAIIMYGVQII
ncbi:MAG: hypothetical protein KKA65_00040 [Nanoarchaeota archaeon]|nr:hypothetical protein [Nanoarchaeota archaeon]MBU4242534.1 hypothetical protein [Nanoarchaeota archaeon]MBU4351553.1 hypothetical protein [Nanoarchaeota archaeon]MBU4455875.1 hypothetical protein [Nanoarchaeota archaeon]MCG2719741.1 hypothetical protein [Nanoarchaeota archaeon]